jgi:trk system potassium uptake protein TrkA
VYVIVAGCGRVGSSVARQLAAEGHDVVVVDRDAESFTLLGDGFTGETVVGPAIDWETLRQAGVEGADALAVATGGDNTNIVCALIAARAFELPCVVARVHDPRRAQAFAAAGIRTVCPTAGAGEMMLDAIRSCDARGAGG